MLAVQILMKGVVINRTTVQQKRCRPHLTGLVTTLGEKSMRAGVTDIKPRDWFQRFARGARGGYIVVRKAATMSGKG